MPSSIINRQTAKEKFITGNRPQEEDWHALFSILQFAEDFNQVVRIATQNEIDAGTLSGRIAVNPFQLQQAITRLKDGVQEDGNTLRKLRTLIGQLESWKNTMTQADSDTYINTIREITTFLAGTSEGQNFVQLLAAKADKTHTHDDRYYTESEVNDLLGGKENTFSKNTAFNRNFAPLVAHSNRPNANVVPRAVDTLMDRGMYFGDLNMLHSAERMGVYYLGSYNNANRPSGATGDCKLLVMPENQGISNGERCSQLFMAENLIAYRARTDTWRAWMVVKPSVAGVAILGEVSSDGNPRTLAGSSFAATRTGRGAYRVTHNLGHTRYKVFFSVTGNGITIDNYATVRNMSTNSFEVVVLSGGGSGALEDADFTFQLVEY